MHAGSRRSRNRVVLSPVQRARDLGKEGFGGYCADMPNTKRSHGRRKRSKQQTEESARGVSRFQSDPKQHKPTPAVPVSTVKPTEHEKGTAASSSTGTAAKPVTLPVTTVGAGQTTAKGSTGPSLAPRASGGCHAGAAGSADIQSGSSKVAPQAPLASPAKAPQTSSGSGVTGGVGVGGGSAGGGRAEKLSTNPVKPQDTSKDKAQGTAISSPKPDPTKVPSSGVARASANVSASAAQKDGAKSKDVKVPADDPFDALADSLPSADPLPPTSPQFTGPEVKERGITSEKANRCGDREDTLPPGYRREDMEKKIPVGVPDKPEKQPKPITTDEALESLSAGFVSSEVTRTSKPGEKAETVDAVNVRGSHAPPPSQKKQEVCEPASKCPAVPCPQSVKPKVHMEGSTHAAKPSAPEKKIPAGVPDKPKEHPKPLIDDAVESLSAGFVSSSAPKQIPGEPMALDALEALGDMLPVSVPAPETPAPRPEDIVHEGELDPEKGVLVGEREDTIPPEYRFPKEDLKKYPPPPKEPSLDPAEALDLLSSDFSSPAAAPVVHAPVPPSAAPKQVACGVPPVPAQVTQSTVKSTAQGDPMSLDALSALGDTLPVAQPTPESPTLRPEDIVDEKKLKSEKGVFVGEREDTIPPEYRFPKGDASKQPAPPQREPSMDTATALDLLSDDFSDPADVSACHASLPPSAPPADISADLALEDLASDFVAPSIVSTVQSAAPAPPKADRQLSENTTSALDALGDTLKDIGTVPEPAAVSPKDIIKEKEAKEERVSKPGERDDSLPPEYRPTQADIKAAAEAKAKAKAEGPAKQTSMDESAALDALSSDFSMPSVAPPAAPVASSACPPHGPAATPTRPQTKPGQVLDSHKTTLLQESTPKDSKPKAKGGKSKSKPKKPAVASAPASDAVSGKVSSEVVSTSLPKKGGKS